MSEGRGRRALLALYPPRWRDRYADEMLGFLDDEHGARRLPLRAALDVAIGAAAERGRAAFDVAEGEPAGRDATRGLRLLAWGWCACVVGGIGFAKLAEHVVAARPYGTGGTGLVDAGYYLVQASAIVALVLMTAIAVPAVVVAATCAGAAARRRLVRGAVAAGTLSVVTAGWLAWLAIWARSLSTVQRNGADSRYGLAAIGLALLVAAMLVAWTRVVSVALRSVSPGRAARLVVIAARAAALAMLAVAGGVATWWVAVARVAPGFLGSVAGHGAAAQWPLLAVAEVLVIVGAASATVGAFGTRAPRGARSA